MQSKVLKSHRGKVVNAGSGESGLLKLQKWCPKLLCACIVVGGLEGVQNWNLLDRSRVEVVLMVVARKIEVWKVVGS